MSYVNFQLVKINCFASTLIAKQTLFTPGNRIPQSCRGMCFSMCTFAPADTNLVTFRSHALANRISAGNGNLEVRLA